MINNNIKRYPVLATILFLLFWGLVFSSCTKYYYGSAANKAFCKPLEREYTRHERLIKRNGGNNPDYPYRLTGKLIDEDSNEIMYGATHDEGSYYRRFTDMDGRFELRIADSQFVKNKYILKVEFGSSMYEPAEFVIRKKDFEDNYLDTTLMILWHKVYLD